jgi:hypothetical protein
MSRRARQRLVARIVAAALLFAHALVAFANCQMPARSAAAAIAGPPAAAGEAKCHEQSRMVNLCVAHCLGEDQSLDKPTSAVPVASSAAVLVLHDGLLAPRSRLRSEIRAPAAIGPPPRIRFQSLLL